ncbi:MAG: hypothetical protein ACRDHF_18545, partial [Tepidiformaceae bacterium]
ARERIVSGRSGGSGGSESGGAANAREAWELARAAENAAPTSAGKRLQRLAQWLGEEEARR